MIRYGFEDFTTEMHRESTQPVDLQEKFSGFAVAKPFLKWAGGKRQLIRELIARAPKQYRRYWEPFLGGAALFFALNPRRATLSDLNPRLTRTYRGIQQNAAAVIKRLSNMPNEEAFFLSQRKRDIDQCDDTELAAWMIYLNRTAFNGLYRVNRKGQFNVPFGHYKKPKICDQNNLFTVAQQLEGVEIAEGDFERIAANAKRGDFVYFDPPYAPIGRHSDFTRYTSESFNVDSQVRLCDLARRLKRNGVNVLLSNSDTPIVRDLYADSFAIDSVLVNRHISAKGSARGKVGEVIIY